MGEIFVYILVFCVLGWEVAALSSYIWLSIKRRSSKNGLTDCPTCGAWKETP